MTNTKISIEQYNVKFSAILNEDISLKPLLIEFLNLLRAVRYSNDSLDDITNIIEDYFETKKNNG